MAHDATSIPVVAMRTMVAVPILTRRGSVRALILAAPVLPGGRIVAPLIAGDRRQLGRNVAILDHGEVAALAGRGVPAVVVVRVVAVAVAEHVVVGPLRDRHHLDARAADASPMG